MIKKRPFWILSVLVVVAVLLVNLFLLSRSSCTTLQTINATITIKIIPSRAMLGMNADTDALTFGVVSPGIAAMRKVNVQHSRNASVQARMEGELGRWTSISPSEFELSASGAREVAFEVNVPMYALPGNYSGTAAFCIKDK